MRRDERVAGLTGFAGALTESAYCATVEQIRALIADGECYQVNFTFPLKARSYGAPLALYARLRQAQAVRYGAFVRHPGGVMLSRSPELFVARSGAKLTTRPMKGTAPLGHADALAGSVKDRAENLMIVDLIRNDLGRITPNGGVQVERLFEIENYATLHQMTSTITAEPVRADIGEILGALFPCGSVTGAPKIRAMELIRELEREPRGIYCGALGWIAPGGDFALNVPIRTLEIDRDRNTRLGIGSGIVADSNPRAEWSECTAKARFVTALSPEFELFETLRWEGVERHCPLLDRHLARLERSARTLGFRFQREEIVGVLTRAVSEIRDAVPRRIRLVLKANGDIGVTHAVLDPMADHPTVTIAGAILDSRDPLLAHKTTRRAMYDDTLRAATSAGHFDALFFNELGELCEGARTNVFVRLTGVLLTPPVACGLLPGVMRQVLLDEGKAVESVLRKTDLKHAEAIYVSNALRGLIEVSLAS
nr:aminodeoxychorismate synthase component I [Niveibacterium umoris]